MFLVSDGEYLQINSHEEQVFGRETFRLFHHPRHVEE